MENVRVHEEAGKTFPKVKPHPEKQGQWLPACKSANTDGEVGTLGSGDGQGLGAASEEGGGSG